MITGMPSLNIGPTEIRLPIIQGGMGVGVSLSRLASSVSNEGGLGVIAAAGIGLLERGRAKGMRAANSRILAREIQLARRASNGPLGVNLMAAMSDFDDLVAVAVENGVDVVFIGAGMPLKVPTTVTLERLKACHTSFVPKVSSPRAVQLILKYWSGHYDEAPAAFVLEGPRAGGHLGFRKGQLEGPSYSLESMLPEVVAAVAPYEERFGRRIPVIAAGGVFSGADILSCLEMGAAGVKMGTRFVGTFECDAHPDFKEAYLRCGKDDLVIIDSPVGLPGRAIGNEFLREVARGIRKPCRCSWQCLTSCNVKDAPYCIAKALKQACLGHFKSGFVFAGSNAFRVEELVSVPALMASLVREFEAATQRRGLIR